MGEMGSFLPDIWEEWVIKKNLKLHPVIERQHHISTLSTIAPEPLDVLDLPPRDLHHVLALEPRAHLHPLVGYLVTSPRLACERCSERDHADHGDEREAWDEGLGDGGWAFREDLLGHQLHRRRGVGGTLGLLLRVLALDLPRLGLGGLRVVGGADGAGARREGWTWRDHGRTRRSARLDQQPVGASREEGDGSEHC